VSDNNCSESVQDLQLAGTGLKTEINAS